MNRSCSQCGNAFALTQPELGLLARLAPRFGQHTIAIPPPTLCPYCRFLRRAAHRNERFLYRRPCAITGKTIVSVISPDKPYQVCEARKWWGDDWDPKRYGRDYDGSRSFFEQLNELRHAVPRLPLLSVNSENSDFTNHALNNRNCYFSTILIGCQDVYYSRKILSSSSIVDSAYIFGPSELLYECFFGERLYNCMFCCFCTDCSDLQFCYDCRACRDCFMSSNLRRRQYVFRNVQLSADDYKKRMNELAFGRHSTLERLKTEFAELRLATEHPAVRLEECEDSTGDYLAHVNNCHNCFYSSHGENCIHCLEFDPSDKHASSRDCADCFGFSESELLYETQACRGYRDQFCSYSYSTADSSYLDMCFNVSHCFGCVGLHGREQYCIMNKQYSKAEYERLVPRIIENMVDSGEWGEFFPARHSVFGYNESVAQDYRKLTRDDALSAGYKWSEYDVPPPDVQRTILAQEIPDNINNVSDEILSQAIICEASGKPFRIVRPELAFYRQTSLPLPRLHPDQRSSSRMGYRNPPRLWPRSCECCSKAILTSFAPDRQERVLCLDCYGHVVQGG